MEIKLSGMDLEEVSGLHFSDARITAKAGAGGVFVVSVPKQVEPGVYDVRAIGRNGISNPRNDSPALRSISLPDCTSRIPVSATCWRPAGNSSLPLPRCRMHALSIRCRRTPPSISPGS